MSIYGLLIGICLALGSWYFSKHNNSIPKDKEDLFVIGTIITAIIGARAYHVIGEWSYYSQHLGQIINTRAGGLGIYGGLIGGFLFAALFCTLTKTSLLATIDTIIPILPLTQAIGRWGNFANTEGFGIPTYSNWGQFIPLGFRPLQYRSYGYFHPAWFYESILDFILFIVLIKNKRRHPLALYLIGYGTIRFIVEFFRWDTWQINGIKIAQIVSFLIVIGGFTLFYVSRCNLSKR